MIAHYDERIITRNLQLADAAHACMMRVLQQPVGVFATGTWQLYFSVSEMWSLLERNPFTGEFKR